MPINGHLPPPPRNVDPLIGLYPDRLSSRWEELRRGLVPGASFIFTQQGGDHIYSHDGLLRGVADGPTWAVLDGIPSLVFGSTGDQVLTNVAGTESPAMEHLEGGQQVTVHFLVNWQVVPVTGIDRRMWANAASTATNDHSLMCGFNGSRFRMRVEIDGTVLTAANGENTMVANTWYDIWYLVNLVPASDNFEYFQDETRIGAVTSSSGGVFTLTGNARDEVIGNSSDGGSEGIEAHVGQFHMWDRTLTAAERAAVMEHRWGLWTPKPRYWRLPAPTAEPPAPGGGGGRIMGALAGEGGLAGRRGGLAA